jgi:hypothetical protein
MAIFTHFGRFTPGATAPGSHWKEVWVGPRGRGEKLVPSFIREAREETSCGA